jgi:hypothetical protein
MIHFVTEPKEKAMRRVAQIAGWLTFAVSAGALAVAEPESVSLQDLKPECKERHAAGPPERCMIEDRLPPRQYARRFGESVIVIVPTAPATPERQTATATPTGVNSVPAPR